MVSQGTELEGASLDMVLVATRNTCRTCGRTTDAEDVLLACPDCGGLDIDFAGG